jgi:dihydrofolate synthase/folylpolyglutamate synthase
MRANIERLEGRGHWGIKCGLDNPRALLASLDHPERTFPALEIVGTNGKGSTGAFLANALRAAGLVVGWTTSPHLISPTERIWVDGAFIDEAALDRLLGEAFAAERHPGHLLRTHDHRGHAGLPGEGRGHRHR